jgi:uncharacterized protein YbaR (Trm112 family)
MINEELLKPTVCPMGKAELRLESKSLVCTRCGPRFAIEDDLPNLVIEEAQLPPGCHQIADLECVRSGDVKLDFE